MVLQGRFVFASLLATALVATSLVVLLSKQGPIVLQEETYQRYANFSFHDRPGIRCLTCNFLSSAEDKMHKAFAKAHEFEEKSQAQKR
jgi:hypothetical protein